MAETTNVKELESRLQKAASMYKELKELLESKEKEIENLKKHSGDTKLLERIEELENELTLVGNYKEEVESLKERLEKAKNIFDGQKEKISGLNKSIDDFDRELSDTRAERDDLYKMNSKLRDKLGQIESIISE